MRIKRNNSAPEDPALLVEETIGEDGAVRGSKATELRTQHPGMGAYLLKVLGVLAVLYVIPFCLARSSFYDRWNPSFFARPLNYAFTTAGENADVVIFGDSTALFGVNPSLISSALGVKALNLVNTQPSLVVNDDMSLQRYLAGNRPPKLIVFYFAPWDFDYGHLNFESRPVYEGEELLVRQGTPRQLLAFLIHHPSHAISFPTRFYATAWELARHPAPHSTQDAQLRETKGYIDNIDPTTMKPSCNYPQLLIDNVRFGWVRSLGERYKSSQTQVLFYVAPVSACINSSSVINMPYDQLPAAPPRPAPPEFFAEDVRYIHPHPFAVPVLSGYLTDAIRPLLAGAKPSAQPAK
jgi:hypothetical protein